MVFLPREVQHGCSWPWNCHLPLCSETRAFPLLWLHHPLCIGSEGGSSTHHSYRRSIEGARGMATPAKGVGSAVLAEELLPGVRCILERENGVWWTVCPTARSSLSLAVLAQTFLLSNVLFSHLWVSTCTFKRKIVLESRIHF